MISFVAALLIAYGVGELVNGCGFLSVFVAAVTAKQREINSSLHKKTHKFIDQIERVVMVIILSGFGGLLAGGGCWSLLSTPDLAAVRPARDG